MDFHSSVWVAPAIKRQWDDHIADLVWESDPPLMGLIFGDLETLRRVARADWPAGAGLLSYRNVMVALDEDRVVGVVVAMGAPEFRHNEAATLARSRGEPGLNGEPGPRIALSALDWLCPKLPDDAYYVLELAVLEDRRGAGIGRLLMTAAEDRARLLRCRSLHIDTALGGPGAEFCRHLGFTVLVETTVPRLSDRYNVPPHARLAKALNGAGLMPATRSLPEH
jgi:GNAT superfamily N-acetyltransferase